MKISFSLMACDGAGAGLENPGRAPAAGAGLSMEVWQGEQLLAAQQELAVISLVDLSAPGESICVQVALHCTCHAVHNTGGIAPSVSISIGNIETKQHV
jgi:hypothetical protein